MDRRAFLASAGAASSAALAGCSTVGSLGFGGREDGCGEGCDVGMVRNAFRPETYEVAVGETVVWENTSDAAHTVTAYDAGIPDGADYFASGGYDDQAEAWEAWETRGGAIEIGETFEHRFDVPGTYDYACIPHEAGGMIGRIVVTE